MVGSGGVVVPRDEIPVSWDCSFAVTSALWAVCRGRYSLHHLHVLSAAVRGNHGWITMWANGQWSKVASAADV